MSFRSRLSSSRIFWIAILGCGVGLAAGAAHGQQITAPGFQIELLASPPEIEHPSVVTCDPEGNLYVGEDPMDMRGPTTKEFDRVLLFRWDRATGKPVKTVFCENLSAVFGLVWHEGALYVMHAPHYTRFRDTNGDGVADEREELADGFGPKAGVFGFNDHIVTGTRIGLDGLIYVSVGDKGIQKATGSDGGTITLEGGGVARMRPDGSRLEIVSSGTRNHLDVAMDSLDNIFTYDNTDDGVGWWTRFTHHVPTGYYGYPYDYHPHPERHLPRMSEHGGGSPVGAACYCEAAWPAEYRENAFHCEWGKGKVQRFALAPSGATFTSEISDFMIREGGEEFRPLDLCFSPDGKHMYVADWNYAGWVRPTVKGRLYRVTYTGGDVPPEPARATDAAPLADQIRSLGHPAKSERLRAEWALARLGTSAAPAVAAALHGGGPKMARIHAIWTQNQWIDRQPPFDPANDWVAALKDAETEVRAQAARALGLRRVKSAVKPLIACLSDASPTVRMWAAIGLGRLGDRAAAAPLLAALSEQDTFARFAMVQALRAIGDWSGVARNLDSPSPDVRAATLLALTGVYDDAAVGALAALAKRTPDEATRAAAITAIAEVHHKAAPYIEGWWGTRPAMGKPRRPKDIEWSGTSLVMNTLRDALLAGQEQPCAAAIKAFEDIRDPEAEKLFVDLANDKSVSDSARVSAFAWLAGQQKLEGPARDAVVHALANTECPTPLVLAALEVAKTKDLGPEGRQAVERLLSDARAAVRAAAIGAFASSRGEAAGPQVALGLNDPEAEVRRAAIKQIGELKYLAAETRLLELAREEATRDDAIDTLLAMPDRRALAVYLDALGSKNSTRRDAARKAMASLRDAVSDDLLALHARNELPKSVFGELLTVFDLPKPIMKWQVSDSWSKELPLPSISARERPARRRSRCGASRSRGAK